MSTFTKAISPAIKYKLSSWLDRCSSSPSGRAHPFRFQDVLRVFAVKSASCSLSLTREFHAHGHPSLLELILSSSFPSVEGCSWATHLSRLFRGSGEAIHITGSVVPLTKAKRWLLASSIILSLKRPLQALLLLINHTLTPGPTSGPPQSLGNRQEANQIWLQLWVKHYQKL